MNERERIEVTGAYDLDYKLLQTIAQECGGWIRSSGRNGDTAEAWHEDKTYVFSDQGLVSFLYAVKDVANERVYAALDLCEYIEKSAKTPPSVFVRDAIVTRAEALRRQIKGES